MALRVKNNTATVNALRNLSNTQTALGKSLERLSSGQKINRGADAPAGLIISENLRGQIAGIDQAISNSEFSISMVQTAEGALTEVNNLLIQMRQLALAAANEGANDDNTLQALQDQLQNALESIDRVSSNTRFGNKMLLDGSRGISGVANGPNLTYVGASVKTRTSPLAGYQVEIKELAARSSASGELSQSQVEDLQLSLTEEGKSITVSGQEDETVDSFVSRLKREAENSGLDLEIDYDKDSEVLTVQHRKYGAEKTFQVTTNIAGILADSANQTTSINNGQDVAGTINGEAAVGKGQILKGKEGNRNTEGLMVQYQGPETGVVGSVSVSQNALVFQVGPNRAQTVSVAIDSTSSTALARGLDNESKFKSLSDINLTSVQGAKDSLLFVDEAINQLSRIRGTLGAFQKNSLESNVATLRITAENLIAAESSIRDTDVAYEIAEFTKHRILTETAAAAVAQANQLPVSALRMLGNDVS